MNIKEMLEETVSEVPQKDAMVCGSQRISYRELDEASNRVANVLIELGLEKGDHVAILMSHSTEWMINYFGVIKAGGISVILNSMLKAPEYDVLLPDSDSKMLITEKSFSQMLSSVLPDISSPEHLIEVDSESYQKMIASSSSASPSVDIRDDDEAAIIYTAGVLGKQKGIVHTHSSLMSAVFTVAPGLGQKREDVIVSRIPFFYVLGLVAVALITFYKGSTVVILPHFTPRNVLEAVEQERATMLVGVPAMFNALAMLDDDTLKRYNLSSLRVALTGGAKSWAPLMRTLEERFGLTLCEIYGTTEALGTTLGGVHNRKLGTAGRPIEATKIIDADGNEVPQGEIGELICRSPMVMKGYYKAPDLTAQVLEDSWFHTGDLVRMDEDGYLEYIEKKSSIIVTSAGVKIPPTEVENVFLKHSGVAEAAYVGVEGEYKGQIPTLFVVLKEGQSATAKEIRSFCRQSLADYKLPRKIEFVDSIPKTGSGKIDWKQLKEGRVSQK